MAREPCENVMVARLWIRCQHGGLQLLEGGGGAEHCCRIYPMDRELVSECPLSIMYHLLDMFIVLCNFIEDDDIFRSE